MKMRRLVAAVAASSIMVLGVAGCAVVMKGQYEDVSINATEERARVTVNGEDMGFTPLKLRLASNKEYRIEFEKPGFEKKVVRLTNNIGPGYIIADILLGLVPIVIDAATGAWYQLDQTNVNAVLERQQ